MIEDTRKKQQILIVDDSEMNRDILSEMLDGKYQIIEASDGAEAVAILQKSSINIDLVLLDIVMPVMDGYEVLKVMNKKHWIDDIPVIMISAEKSSPNIERAYSMGVTDFITRPFDAFIVRRRVVNVLMLYAKQKRLAGMVAEQIYEKEKNNSLMINILSHIVEFRNGESGLHIIHVKTFTEILLKRLVQLTDKYNLSSSDITLIINASALHDIGKISVPDEILNKPGRLTNEEFEIMKTHSTVGASMLDDLPCYKNEPLVQKAYEICRWHHERYDGRGYPDGLLGDEIPISAQIVSLADVYDALTSERVYKKAFSHETAMNMILNGECGTFNPILIQCLKDAAKDIINELKGDSIVQNKENDIKNAANEMLSYDELVSTKNTLDMIAYEQDKIDFFTSIADGILFDYTFSPSILKLSPYGAEYMHLQEVIVNPEKDEKLRSLISDDDFIMLLKEFYNTTQVNPNIECICKINFNGEWHDTKIICRTIWSKEDPPHRLGLVGKLINLDNKDIDLINQ